MSTPTEVAQRRAKVRQLSHGGASNRAIAQQLGISKDTVRRDLEAPDAPPATPAQRIAQRAAQTESAMSQLRAAAQAVDDARPAYTITDEATARRWCAELRATAAHLAALADAFAEYYPSATARATVGQGS
ncbi:DeoR family transcriptional regulator [Streptomyces sp.]|uniref:DeoR family transcriptional regulator n=1 Tax=Streptomyces sp. TaxID=1931 RepID=UPI002D77952E|nr:DeoR family transcriptional regulator [Streptomyces sp.]HET6356002.1 DeoR family transcriptional regulator [Streptomyces sp.]